MMVAITATVIDVILFITNIGNAIMARNRSNRTAQTDLSADTKDTALESQDVSATEEQLPADDSTVVQEQSQELSADASGEVSAQAIAEPVADEPVLDNQAQEVAPEANYLSLPKEIRDAQASQEIIHTPTGQRLQPPMNPFMKMEAERVAKQTKSAVPTGTEMIALLKDKFNIDVSANYVLGAAVSRLNKYVEEMAPNVPVSPDMGANYQRELAGTIFEALSAAPDVALATLKVIEEYFRQYGSHALAQTHVYRYMDMVRLSETDLQAFQALLHMFVELANPDNQTRREIQRKINLTRIAELMPNNTDAQARLVEFLS